MDEPDSRAWDMVGKIAGGPSAEDAWDLVVERVWWKPAIALADAALLLGSAGCAMARRRRLVGATRASG